VVGWWALGVADGEALPVECLTKCCGHVKRFLLVDLGE
jgi:hypothetical protein